MQLKYALFISPTSLQIYNRYGSQQLLSIGWQTPLNGSSYIQYDGTAQFFYIDTFSRHPTNLRLALPLASANSTLGFFISNQFMMLFSNWMQNV